MRRSAFAVQNAVDFWCARRCRASRASDRGGEVACGRAAALVAGAVASGERCRLVEKEELGVAGPHDCAVPVPEGKATADPCHGTPTSRANLAVVVVKPATAIPHQQTAVSDRMETSVRRDAVAVRSVGQVRGFRI